MRLTAPHHHTIRQNSNSVKVKKLLDLALVENREALWKKMLENSSV